ncbi:MAG: heterodisulfide reductase subunit C [Deltaproteobacteria bacterium]|nr:MAG: heterodisulfide reductase subunit C [Deltaproteobacteria bacterium]
MLKYNAISIDEIFKNVDYAEEIQKCMQCGMCAGSCPLRHHMDFPPRKIFALLRAGEIEKVLNSKSILLCTSCYSCMVRCPRGIHVMDIMHGLAHYAIRLGRISRKKTATFGQEFWRQVYERGRVDEKDLSRRYFFSNGFIEGIKNAVSMADMGLVMLFHGRMKLLPEKKIKGIKELRLMLDKAQQM